MTEAHYAELEQTLSTSLRSSTIEWALNLRICDLLQANPDLTSIALQKICSRLRKDSPVPVLLALGLLEMMVKNCGINCARHVDEHLMDALLAVVKKREDWKYSLGRNLHKSVGSWLPQGVGIGEADRKLWLQASRKVLELLQLWADAFLLQEGELQPIFAAYKKLRMEGHQFPRGEHGASSGLCLVQGAEESPAFQAGCVPQAPPASSAREADAQPAATATPAAARDVSAQRQQDMSSAEAVANTVASEARAVVASIRSAGHATGDLRSRAVAARAAVVERVQAVPDDQAQLVEFLDVLEELNAVLPAEEEQRQGSEGAAGSSRPPGDHADGDHELSCDDMPPVPPPPSDAPPTKEEQEMYDLMLARWLQERENANFIEQEEADAALALRLSLEDNGFDRPQRQARPQASARVASCGRCGALNQLAVSGEGHRGASFICYACGLTQGLRESQSMAPLQQRAEQARQEAAMRPARHAPPARVICASGSELLIGGDGAMLDAEVAASRGHASAVTSVAASAAAVASSAANKAVCAAVSAMAPNSSSSAMTTGSSGGARLAPLLGSAPEDGGGSLGKSASYYASSIARAGADAMSGAVGYVAGSGSDSSVKRLGDGAVPSSEYAEMRDDCAPLCGGPPGESRPSTGGGGLPWKSPWKSRKSGKRSGGEGEQPLLDRVRVDEEWEMIRQIDGRSYFHNSTTQVSQWQPPDAVSREYAQMS